MGRVATILFAHRLGTSLEPECKMYRLAADIFNDTAMVLDCLSPALPKLIRIFVLSLSSVLRALCGVAAGSSKASLSAHFARWGNLGELNAKDSSQETIISLMGMLAGSVVVSRVSSPIATWSWLMLLLAIHLATNHAAVRAVTLRTLNRQRANIVVSSLIDDDVVLNPQEVSKEERIFESGGALRWKGSPILGFADIGVSFEAILSSLGTFQPRTGSFRDTAVDLTALMRIYRNEQYVLWYDHQRRKALVILKAAASTITQFKGWTHALLVAQGMSTTVDTRLSGSSDVRATLATLESSLRALNEKFDGYVLRIRAGGWDIDAAALETRSGRRLEFPN
ncbi:MAG: hypothetical protein M1817_003923 [Caeruleum heppii]|nr:MAG: hypothetical protein M1817_003923 [Caeruleum heppii]